MIKLFCDRSKWKTNLDNIPVCKVAKAASGRQWSYRVVDGKSEQRHCFAVPGKMLLSKVNARNVIFQGLRD